MWAGVCLNFAEILHLDCLLLCHRAAQGQDRSQSGNRGSSGWEQFHLDTIHPQLDLVQYVHCWPGVWAGDNDGLQIQGKIINWHLEICSNVSWSFCVTLHLHNFPSDISSLWPSGPCYYGGWQDFSTISSVPLHSRDHWRQASNGNHSNTIILSIILVTET